MNINEMSKEQLELFMNQKFIPEDLDDLWNALSVMKEDMRLRRKQEDKQFNALEYLVSALIRHHNKTTELIEKTKVGGKE